MKKSEFNMRLAGDPRLAVHATSALPAWLWSADGTRVLWANPVAARLFDASSGASLSARTFGPADPHRRQVARLAQRLLPAGTVRMERLRGFGAALGMLATCACARLDLADGEEAVLIVATDVPSRTMPLAERLQHLVKDTDEAIAAFASDGELVAASAAATPLFGFQNLAAAGLDEARLAALKDGRREIAFGAGTMSLQRVGRGADLGLLAFITPAEAVAEPAPEFDEAESAVAAHEPTNQTGDEVAPDTSAEALVASSEDSSPSEMTGSEAARSELAKSHAGLEARADVSRQTVPSGAAPATRLPAPRRHPLRFMWQMSADGRFSLGSDAFTRLIGVQTAAAFGRPWREIADQFGLDPQGLVLSAVATGETWSGITLNWPVDDGSHLPVELSGLPIHDAAKNFIGYRGFGVCRDLAGLSRLDALRSQEFFNDPPSADMILSEIGPSAAAAWPAMEPLEPSIDAAITAGATSRPLETAPSFQGETALDSREVREPPPPNVIPFRAPGEAHSPGLTAGEDTAFNELGRQLSLRLEGGNSPFAEAPKPAFAEPAPPTKATPAAPNWLAQTGLPASGESARDKALFDLLPTGVLIYRLDRLLYANRAFLDRMGYTSLAALEHEGGLDALYVEPGVSSASSTSETGTTVMISAPHGASEAASHAPIEARLHTINWDEDTAHALIFSTASVATAELVPAPGAPAPLVQPSPVGHANAEELAAMLDATADAIVMFDAEGNINSANRSAEALFGFDGGELARRNVFALLAPESEGVARQYLESLKGAGVTMLLEHGQEVLGRVHDGGLIPLSMTLGRTQAQGPNFFAVLRDLSQTRKGENELREAKRLAERAGQAKADLLARISHEVRAPLDAIVGFADVMMSERFGALGNERYVEYLKDVRGSGERVLAVIDDLTNLSRIETGRLDLAFTDQNLNDVVESCVAVMQPQAKRERIIIRTSLAQTLPPVVADALALRQITMNLIGNSIHLANAGGQVIVSTALTDLGAVALRIRDTGHGLNDNEVAAALEPFRNAAEDQAPQSGISLSLTKALVEANRAQFNIKAAAHSGTLVEVVFSHTPAKARN